MLWVLVGVAIVTLYIFSLIDDWGRDLTTNFAQTDPLSTDLRPIELPLPPDRAATLVRQAAESLRGWQVADAAPRDLGGGAIEWHFVRTTLLMRYKDDVHARIEPSASGESVTVHLRSRSRIGKGDLGQNPRNLRELLGAIERSLRTSEGPPGG